MRYPSRLPATALSILSCACLVVAGGLAGVGTAAASSRRTAEAATHASTGCSVGAARSTRRTRTRAHVCRTSARRTHARKAVQPSPASTPTTLATSPPLATPVVGRPEQNGSAVIAAVLATPCQNTELMPEAGNIELIRAAVLCLINRERAQNGEGPLKLSGQLERAAEGHTEELVSEDYFAHVSPSGETPVDRIRTTGYIPGPSVGYVIGENLAWGTYNLATPQAIVAAWIASPGHLANILEAQYRETGIGVTPAVPGTLGDGAPGATYAQEFGVIIR